MVRVGQTKSIPMGAYSLELEGRPDGIFVKAPAITKAFGAHDDLWTPEMMVQLLAGYKQLMEQPGDGMLQRLAKTNAANMTDEINEWLRDTGRIT